MNTKDTIVAEWLFENQGKYDIQADNQRYVSKTGKGSYTNYVKVKYKDKWWLGHGTLQDTIMKIMMEDGK